LPDEKRLLCQNRSKREQMHQSPDPVEDRKEAVHGERLKSQRKSKAQSEGRWRAKRKEKDEGERDYQRDAKRACDFFSHL